MTLGGVEMLLFLLVRVRLGGGLFGVNFRLLSDTPIAPAGRRLSGADIFAPPAEVCGTNFPLPLLPLGVSCSGVAYWA